MSDDELREVIKDCAKLDMYDPQEIAQCVIERHLGQREIDELCASEDVSEEVLVEQLFHELQWRVEHMMTPVPRKR